MRRLLAATALSAVALTGCSNVTPPDSGPERVKTDVDTPGLRTMKKAAGVEACAPPRNGDAVNGGSGNGGSGNGGSGNGGSGDGALPSVTLPCLGGGPDVDVSQLRGPMVINLWASWCGPCRDELPIYQKFHKKYGDRVQVLGINYNDQMPEAAMELLRDTGATYPELADPNTDLAYQDPLPNFQGLPAIIFVDEDGTVVDDEGDLRVMFEEIDSLSELEGLVEKNLDVKL